MADAGDDVKPYKIKVSSKYLQLTRQKLELTRLPHEGSTVKSNDWWEPKPQVEPILDYWLEKYSWAEQEDSFNKSLPQFRTAISLPSVEAPVRLHFIHVRSKHANAIPLLLIPPFPFTNLSLGHLINPFTDPVRLTDADDVQAFHLIMPSLPGVGFSDPLPNSTALVFTVADMLNTLMRRLSYEHYLVSNAGAGHASPAEIDWKLADQLAMRHPDSCLGAHLVSPPLASPHAVKAPWEWTKWVIASSFHAGILGYSHDDFVALDRNNPRPPSSTSPVSAKTGSKSLGRLPKGAITPAHVGLNKLRLREPNTLAYALCDSPTGLLVFALKGLQTLGPRAKFTHDQIITITNLAWLPGPEHAMRFWAHCAVHEHGHDIEKTKGTTDKTAAKPRVAITVFLGGDHKPADIGLLTGDASKLSTLRQAAATVERYVPPAWGRARYDVVHTQRVVGKPGLLAWERPEVIATGVRGLAKEVLAADGRLIELTPVSQSTAPNPIIAPLERIVVRAHDNERASPSIRLPTVHEGQPATHDDFLKRPEPLAFRSSRSRSVVPSSASAEESKDKEQD